MWEIPIVLFDMGGQVSIQSTWSKLDSKEVTVTSSNFKNFSSFQIF